MLKIAPSAETGIRIAGNCSLESLDAEITSVTAGGETGSIGSYNQALGEVAEPTAGLGLGS